MRRHLTSLPLALVTFIVGIVFAPGPLRYDAAVQTPTRFITRSASLELTPDLFGKWGGEDGDVFDIHEGRIRDMELQRTFDYKVIRHVNNRAENGYLLEVQNLAAGSNLRKYVYLRFTDDGWVSYYGYGSLDDVDSGRYTAAGTFSR